MKRLSILLAVLLLAGCAQVNRINRYGSGRDDSNTVNALPVAGTSSFASSTILFLKQEDANRWLEQKFPNFVSSGCVGMTSPGLILTPSACIAYNAGFRSTETGAITLNDNSSTWVAMDENTSGSNAGLPNFTRAGSTHYLLDTLDVSQPTMPNDAQLIARVTTLGGAITAIDQSMKKSTPQTAGPPGATGAPGSTGATGATGAAGPAGPAPTGNIPQIVGYSGANIVEAETVSGDCTFSRTGLNAYAITCTKVNGNAVSATAPTNAQVWVENAGATSMVPVSISGDCTITAAGAITCTKLNGVSPATCTNQFLTSLGACTTDTLASAQHANQGTTTTLLHGNAAGNPAFSPVSLTADVTGTLPIANGGTGTTAGAVVSISNQTITATGAYTPPAGFLFGFFEVCGGGAGGGSANDTAGSESAGSGGGAGSCSTCRLTAAQISGQTATIGAKGNGGASGGTNNGTDGGDSTMAVASGTACVGKGGTHGVGGPAASNPPPAGGAGGVAGTGGTGDTLRTGEAGSAGQQAGSTNDFSFGGKGGSCRNGGGGKTTSATAAACLAGANATLYCSGGGGASCENVTSSAAGGDGSAGLIRVEEFNSQ